MIVFDKLWQTMKEKNISQYQLIKNQNVNSYTLNTLCEILECKLSDIAEYVKE